MIFYIYKVTNLINNKIYIGKTQATIKTRRNSHKTAARKKDKNDYFYIHRAMNKYGFENFKIEPIALCDANFEASKTEKLFIKILKTRDRSIGYNLTDGGDGANGVKISDESKKKMSIAKQGMFLGKDNPFYGKKHNTITKTLMSNLKLEDHKNNPNKYKLLNLKQCGLTTEQCINIQKEYLSKIISFEQLGINYNVKTKTIHRVIHGTYFAIREKSIITEDVFKQIKHERAQLQGLKYRKFTLEQEPLIINDHKSGMMLKDIATKYCTSTVTIRKIINKYNITKMLSY